MKYILSADIGTTALKAAVFDENGRVLGAGLREYATLAPLPGRAEMDPETYLAAFRGSVADALRSSGVRADELLVIGLSTQGETTLLLDENDRPLGNAIVWLDNRALAEAADISAHFGAEEIQRRTGQVGADAIWPGAKLLWIRRNEPERFEKLRRAVQLESWFSLLLTGTAAGEDSILGSSVYFDIRTRSWWPEMLEYIGIPETYLPEIRKPGAIVGHITEEAAGRFGLSSGTLLSIGGIDLACGAVGVGNIRPGAFSDVTGSALCTMTMTDRIVLDPRMQMPCYCSAVPGLYMIHAYAAGGLTLRWIRGVLDLKDTEEMNAYDRMDVLADSVPAGAEGLTVLPHFQGSGPPDLEPRATAVFFGLTLAHGRAHLVRALMESVAMELVRIIDATEALGIKVERIVTLGGGAKSPVWCRIKADACGREVVTTDGYENACALGAAMLAGTEAGVWPSLERAAELLVREDRRWEPDPANAETYRRLSRSYGTLTECTREMYRTREA